MKRVDVFTGWVWLFWGVTATAQPHQTCSGPQIGTWKLQSVSAEEVETGIRTQPYGAHPNGYLSYARDCRMYALILKEGRRAPASVVATDAERIELFNGLVTYAGTYAVEGDKITHLVDASWNQTWTGSIQVRHFKIDGNSLHLVSMPLKDSLDGKVRVYALVWTKVE
jgi:hypothetical protein